MGGQLRLDIYKGKRGGRRPGSGRRRIHSKGVAHRVREQVLLKTPLHINFKFKAFIRNKHGLKLLKRAIMNARSHGLKVLHFSLQHNHVHLVVESSSNAVLTKGMRSLTVTFAKGLNKGKVQIERYHLHVLKTLKEVKNAVYYVLFNHQKHAGLKRAIIDSYSSLGLVKDLKALAKSAKKSIVWRRWEEVALDTPEGWMIKKILNEQNC